MASSNKLPLLTQGEMAQIRAEILAQCEVVGDCWIYRGDLNRDGYGIKRVQGKLHSVSRILLAFATGASLNCRFDACHDTSICPYKSCCNVRHLHWSTHPENCKQRERATRAIRGVFCYWESSAWINGVFYTDRPDPS